MAITLIRDLWNRILGTQPTGASPSQSGSLAQQMRYAANTIGSVYSDIQAMKPMPKILRIRGGSTITTGAAWLYPESSDYTYPSTFQPSITHSIGTSSSSVVTLSSPSYGEGKYIFVMCSQSGSFTYTLPTGATALIPIQSRLFHAFAMDNINNAVSVTLNSTYNITYVVLKISAPPQPVSSANSGSYSSAVQSPSVSRPAAGAPWVCAYVAISWASVSSGYPPAGYSYLTYNQYSGYHYVNIFYKYTNSSSESPSQFYMSSNSSWYVLGVGMPPTPGWPESYISVASSYNVAALQAFPEAGTSYSLIPNNTNTSVFSGIGPLYVPSGTRINGQMEGGTGKIVYVKLSDIG